MTTRRSAVITFTKESNLADALDMLEDQDEFVFSVCEDDAARDPVDVKFYDESGLSSSPDSFFICGFEFGPQYLIHAHSFEDAWGAWVDESQTIPEDELIEAYGITDDYREEFEKTDPCPNHWEPTWDAWHVRFKAACVARLKELGDKATAQQGEYPELVEGYEYQSNSSGTGIVDMGHYAWMREIHASHVSFRRKTDEEKAAEKKAAEEAKAEKAAKAAEATKAAEVAS